jgi:hypothetical protein
MVKEHSVKSVVNRKEDMLNKASKGEEVFFL